MIDKNYEHLSSAQIGNLLDAKEKEMREAQQNFALVEQKDIEYAIAIIGIQAKRKDNQLALSKARFNVRQIGSELREIRNRFWSAKNTGL